MGGVTNLHAQSLRGVVTEAETGEPVIGAAVVQKGTTIGTVTNEKAVNQMALVCARMLSMEEASRYAGGCWSLQKKLEEVLKRLPPLDGWQKGLEPSTFRTTI